MSGHALQNTISDTVSRRWRWRALVACLLLGMLWAATAPVFAQDGRAFARRFPAPAAQPLSVRGDIVLVGNTSMSCQTGATNCAAARSGGNYRNNNFTPMVAVDVDADGTTTNSSSAELDLPPGSTVLFAGLYWGGQSSSASARSSVRFRTAGSVGYTTINASVTDTISNAYQSFANVTSEVSNAGDGTYTVANVAQTSASSQWAGWTLVVAYQNASGDLRNLSVFDGFRLADGDPEYIDISVGGFITPSSGTINSSVGIVLYDGDKGGVDGPQSLQFGEDDSTLSNVSNMANTVTDVYNSTISLFGTNVTARNPSYVNTLGFDIDVFQPNTPLGYDAQTAVARVYATSDDVNYPGVLTIATDVFEPEVVTNFTKSATDANGAPFRPGDEVTYSVNVANTGNDDAEIVVVTDPLPAGVTFVPGSIVVTSGPNAGPKTDTAGDDQAEFNGSQVVFRAGVGANSTDGGVLNPSLTPTPTSATTIEFKVTIDADVANGTSIANVASIGYKSKATGLPGTGSTPPASFTVANETNLQITKTNTPANGPVDGSADTVTAGSSVDYSIVVTNLGPSAANNAVVRDPASTGLTCASAVCGSATNGAVCPSATGAALVTELQSAAGTVIPTMPLNGAVTFTLTCTVAP